MPDNHRQKRQSGVCKADELVTISVLVVSHGYIGWVGD